MFRFGIDVHGVEVTVSEFDFVFIHMLIKYYGSSLISVLSISYIFYRRLGGQLGVSGSRFSRQFAYQFLW